jgi:ribulose kinase
VGDVTGRPVPRVHVVGGGARNTLLNQLTADVTGLPVVAGPVETTALGNALVQLVALGELAGLAEARDVVRAGEPVEHLEPRPGEGWDRTYKEFLARVAQDDEMAGTSAEAGEERSDHAIDDAQQTLGYGRRGRGTGSADSAHGLHSAQP